MHYEDDVPVVRMTTTQGVPHFGPIGIFSDGDPEGAPILTLSEESAHELAIELLANANSTTTHAIHAALQAAGIEL